MKKIACIFVLANVLTFGQENIQQVIQPIKPAIIEKEVQKLSETQVVKLHSNKSALNDQMGIIEKKLEIKESSVKSKGMSLMMLLISMVGIMTITRTRSKKMVFSKIKR